MRGDTEATELLPYCRQHAQRLVCSFPQPRFWPVTGTTYRGCLSEIFHKNNFTILCIPLCVKDCPFFPKDGQSRRFPCRDVFPIEHSLNFMGRGVAQNDAPFL